MKLIDKNGKIFGKFNILDFTVLLFAVLIIFAVFFNKFYPNRGLKEIHRMPQKKEVIAKIILDRDIEWLIHHIKVGDGQRNLENTFIAKIINVKKSRIANTNDVHVIVTLKLKADLVQSGGIIYGGNLLRLGESFVLETKDYLLKGLVYSIGED